MSFWKLSGLFYFFVIAACTSLERIVHISSAVKYENNSVKLSGTVPGISLQDCIEQCKRRPSCDVINYRVAAHVCMFISHVNKTASILIEARKGYIYGNKLEWKMENGNATSPNTTTTAPLFSCPPFDSNYRTFQLEDASTVTYKLVQSPVVTQADAKLACRADGGELIKTVSAARMNFIFALRACTGAPSVDIWIDGEYNDVDLLWHTAGGDVIPVPSNYWYLGKPDRLDTQKCNRLFPTSYLMDNQVCTSMYSYMCELP